MISSSIINECKVVISWELIVLDWINTLGIEVVLIDSIQLDCDPYIETDVDVLHKENSKSFKYMCFS